MGGLGTQVNQTDEIMVAAEQLLLQTESEGRPIEAARFSDLAAKKSKGLSLICATSTGLASRIFKSAEMLYDCGDSVQSGTDRASIN